jgi:hypothetical protein
MGKDDTLMGMSASMAEEAQAHVRSLASSLAKHTFVFFLIVALLGVLSARKVTAYLDHHKHAGEELARTTRLWERNCKHAFEAVDVQGRMDCDELLCFKSKSAHRIALGRTLAELDVLGKIVAPATWEWITSHLGASAFVAVIAYILLAFVGDQLKFRAQLAMERRRLRCEADGGLPTHAHVASGASVNRGVARGTEATRH